jgi:hypothetical protein
MLQEIKSILFIIIGVGLLVGLMYLQVQLLTDRKQYKRKHGVDPWRHGWGLEDDDHKNKD